MPDIRSITVTKTKQIYRLWKIVMTREEAIKIVQSATVWTDEERDALAMLIPELAESEDERIRRWLCDYFSSIDKAWIHKDITCIDILRWLEKQKEQKKEKFPPYVTGFKGHPDPAGTSDLEEAAEKYIQGSMCDLDDGPTVGLAKEAFIAGAKWQKEQKPVEWSKDIIRKAVKEVGLTQHQIDWFKTNVFPPKQEWSEEDKKTIDDAYCWLCEYAGSLIQRNYGKSSMLYGIANKLKSLHSQPKQEWSEEDEANRTFILESLEDQIRFCKKDAKCAYYTKQIRTAQNWLKSLSLNLKKKNEDVAKLCSNK